MTIGPRFMPDIEEPHGEVRARLWLLVPLRLYAGWHFLAAGLSKVAAGMLSDPTLLPNSFRANLMDPEYPYGFYAAFVRGVVDAHPGLFAFLVIFGELLIGLMLLSGALTRLACLLGAFLLVHVILARNAPIFTQVHPAVAMLAIVATLGFTGAGRAFGIDHALHRRLPGWMA